MQSVFRGDVTLLGNLQHVSSAAPVRGAHNLRGSCGALRICGEIMAQRVGTHLNVCFHRVYNVYLKELLQSGVQQKLRAQRKLFEGT